MKQLLFRTLSAIAIIATIASCSKDEVTSPSSNGNNSTSGGDINNPVVAASTGIVAGKITTVSKYELKLYNDDYTLTSFNLDTRTGYFYFKDVLPGAYNLLIHPLDPAYKDREILKIQVFKGELTNVGEISF